MAKLLSGGEAGAEDEASQDVHAIPDRVESKLYDILEQLEIKVYKNFQITRLGQDSRDRLSSIVLEDWNAQSQSSSMVEDIVEETKKDKDEKKEKGAASPSTQKEIVAGKTTVTYTGSLTGNGKRECTLPARILITAHKTNVDPDVFE